MKSFEYDENCKRSRSPRNCSNYNYEYFEKCNNYEDNKGYDDYENCLKNKECLYCPYDCEYCKNLVENEDFRKKNDYWTDVEENDSGNEYFRKCFVKRHASYNPTQIIYRKNNNTDFEKYQNLTMVINSPAKVIIYENEGDENKMTHNKSYTKRKEVLNETNQSSYRNTQDTDNIDYTGKYRNYTYKRSKAKVLLYNE